MEPTGRFFLCARCRAQVLICSGCDRGQIYCTQACSAAARRASLREAGRRYQASRRGRITHAARARRYRERRNKVTHQGSPPAPCDALLPADSALSVPPLQAPASTLVRTPRYGCHVCGRCCAPFVRLGWLRRRVPQTVPSRRGTEHDNWP